MYNDGFKPGDGLGWAIDSRALKTCEPLPDSALISTAELTAIPRSVEPVSECGRPGRRFVVYLSMPGGHQRHS